jgi:hypothetical protein
MIGLVSLLKTGSCNCEVALPSAKRFYKNRLTVKVFKKQTAQRNYLNCGP